MENNYTTTTTPNGSIIVELISQPSEEIKEIPLEPTLEDKINYLYYKDMGVI